MSLASFPVRHPAIITIALVVIVAFGVLSVTGLVQELLPETSQPQVLIVTIYPGASASSVEREVSEVIETAVGSISGVSSVSSNSRESRSMVTVTFDYSVDLDTKIGEVRESLDSAARDLPEDLSGPPSIFRVSTGQLVVYSAQVASSWSPERTTSYLQDVVIPAVARATGVAEASLTGAQETEVEVLFDPDRLAFFEISVLDVMQVLQANGSSLPVGTVNYRQRGTSVRADGSYRDVEQLESLVVGFVDETYVRLRDVADIRIVPVTPDLYAQSAGQDAITIDVQKARGASVIDLVEEIEALLAGFTEQTGGALRFAAIVDTSADIRQSMGSVQGSALYGGLLAVIVLFVFLVNVRTTIVIAVSIPLSIVATFIAMFLGDQTLNLMSLGGLTVGIGMMVDNSVVVLENIASHRERGMPIMEAAELGTSEVAGAIIASTTTSLSVFVPLMFVQGQTGELLGPVAFTIVSTLAASLLVALFVVPYLARFLMAKDRPSGFPRLKKMVDGRMTALERGYRRLLGWSIDNPVFVIATFGIILGFALTGLTSVGFEFIPSSDMNEITVLVKTPVGYTIEETEAKVEELDVFIREAVPELDSSVAYIGQDGSLAILRAPNAAYGIYRLVPVAERDRSSQEIIATLRETIPSQVADASVTVLNGGLDALSSRAGGAVTNSLQGFQIRLLGNDLDDLVASAERVRSLMLPDPAVSEVRFDINPDVPELVVNLDSRALANVGLSSQEVTTALRAAFFGVETATFEGPEGEIPVVVRSTYANSDIRDDVLNRITLRSLSDEFVSVASVASLGTEATLSEINRQQGQRSITVTGIMNTGNLRPTQDRMTRLLEEQPLPPSVTWEVTGSADQLSSSFTDLSTALLIAVFLVYAVMVVQFERFDQPLMVMGSVPFIMIGVVAMLLITGTNLSVIALLGMIALVGIVVNNAIVLIDYTNLLRSRDSLALHASVLEGGVRRLRPILMTTFTTLLGVAPLAFRAGQGSEIYSPLGVTILGGLLTSSLVTLFIIPIIYFYAERARERRRVPDQLEEVHV